MNLITLILTLILGGEPLLVLTPPEWNLGRIEQSGVVVTEEVFVENRSGGEAEITFVSTCDCLWITPAELRLASGQSGSVELTFDPAEEPGPVQKDIVIRTNLQQLPKALYLVQGEVTTGEGTADSRESEITPDTGVGRRQEGSPGARSPALSADFYASPGCRSCQRVLERTIPRIQRRTGITLQVREHNILDPHLCRCLYPARHICQHPSSGRPVVHCPPR